MQTSLTVSLVLRNGDQLVDSKRNSDAVIVRSIYILFANRGWPKPSGGTCFHAILWKVSVGEMPGILTPLTALLPANKEAVALSIKIAQ